MEVVSCNSCKYKLVRYNNKGEVSYTLCTHEHPNTPYFLEVTTFRCSEWEQKVSKGK